MYRYRSVAVALALTAAYPAAAGWVKLSYTPGASSIRSGCVASGQYERAPLAIAGAVAGSVTINGLPDAGRCYFAQDSADEFYFDFGTLASGPSAPGPVSNVNVTWAPTPPITWQSQDIGAPALAGSFAVAGTTLTLKGAGVDVWNAADQFRYAYRQRTGDFSATARVSSQTVTDAWAKAGLMAREDVVNAGARNVYFAVSPGNGVTAQSRSVVGGSSVAMYDSVTKVPVCLRLTRTGNVFQSLKSADCVTFTAYTSVAIAMPATIYVGPAVTSHNAAALSTAVFDNVTVVP